MELKQWDLCHAGKTMVSGKTLEAKLLGRVNVVFGCAILMLCIYYTCCTCDVVYMRHYVYMVLCIYFTCCTCDVVYMQHYVYMVLCTSCICGVMHIWCYVHVVFQCCVHIVYAVLCT